MAKFASKGILPQDWMPDYKSRNEVMKFTHRVDLFRMLHWQDSVKT